MMSDEVQELYTLAGQMDILIRAEDAPTLLRLVAAARAAEWAKAVWVARDLARQGATAQAVLDALLNERARIDGMADGG